MYFRDSAETDALNAGFAAGERGMFRACVSVLRVAFRTTILFRIRHSAMTTIHRFGTFTAALLLFATASLCAQNSDSLRLENLGPSINSEYMDVGPVISPDGKTLYFDRTDHPENVGNDDIWFSTRKPDGSWSPAKNIGSPLNNYEHNYVCTVTPDGNTLLVGNVYLPNGMMGPGVSVVHRERNGWGRPEKLNVTNYYTHGLSANYYLANDGRTLLLALERNDGYGDMDIFVSFVQPNGTWSAPANLGQTINTGGAERTPFLAADGVSLYFASDGHGGLGNSDIFVSRRLDSTWRKWSKPENLGRPINSEGWDGFFTIPASGDYAYLVSSEGAIGEMDIFRVRMRPEMRPNPVVLLSGHVYDARTKRPIASGLTYNAASVRGAKGANGEARTDPSTGGYSATLPAGARYSITASAPGYAAKRASVDASRIDKYTEMTQDFYLVPVAVKKAPTGGPILFASGSAELSAVARRQLDGVAEAVAERSGVRLRLSGHTDDVGEEAANQELSVQRVNAAAEYLIQHGVAADRIERTARGETEPARPNSTASGRQRNRRVEVVVE